MDPQHTNTHTETILGINGFFLMWAFDSYQAHVVAYSIEAIEDGDDPQVNRPLFLLGENGGSPDVGYNYVRDHTKADPYLDAIQKADGCLDFISSEMHVWNGAQSYTRHILLLQHIYKKAFELMNREPHDPWELSIVELPLAERKRTH